MRRSFFGELYRRNRLLTLVGWLHVLLLLATIVGYASDDRTVMAVPAAMVMLLAACGDDDSGATTAPTTGNTTASTTGNTIEVLSWVES